MNCVIISGNLARDVQTRNLQSGNTVADFTVAVNRRFTDQNGVRTADFIDCVAFGKTAEFVSKYFSKGKRIEIRGSLQTRSYMSQDGSKRYVTEVLVDEAGFGERGDGSASGGNPNANAPASAPAPVRQSDAYSGYQEAADEDLPF